MNGWIEAPDCPVEWEGTEKWKWYAGDKYPPFIDVVPKGFSRERYHCSGVWWHPVDVPEPPLTIVETKQDG